jgi:hypothetical protein
MTVSPRHWWIGVACLTAVVLFHALFPRYEYRHPGLGYAGNVAAGAFYTEGLQWPGTMWIRIDRWTGNAEIVLLQGPSPAR